MSAQTVSKPETLRDRTLSERHDAFDPELASLSPMALMRLTSLEAHQTHLAIGAAVALSIDRQSSGSEKLAKLTKQIVPGLISFSEVLIRFDEIQAAAERARSEVANWRPNPVNWDRVPEEAKWT